VQGQIWTQAVDDDAPDVNDSWSTIQSGGGCLAVSSDQSGPVTLNVGPCGTNLSTWYTARDPSSGGTTWSPVNDHGLCLTLQPDNSLTFDPCTPGTYNPPAFWGFNTAGPCYQALFTWSLAWCLTVNTTSTMALP
jgi:hypothetical protein